MEICKISGRTVFRSLCIGIRNGIRNTKGPIPLFECVARFSQLYFPPGFILEMHFMYSDDNISLWRVVTS